MHVLKSEKKIFEFSILSIIIFNLFLITSIPLGFSDQCLNILLSIGIFENIRNNRLEIQKKVSLFDASLSLGILFSTLYKIFWTYSYKDNFIFFIQTFLLISLLIINFSLKNVFLNWRVILISAIYPFQRFIYIPLSIILTPLSTVLTWFLLNIFGFNAYTKGQEIFIGNGGVLVSFSCSGSDQIIFAITSMLVLNLVLPFKRVRYFYLQLIITFLITFMINIFRLCILAIFVDTYNSDNFSVFDFFHGSKGGLIFSLISTALSCEVYKKLYVLNKLNY
tara:strand:+ start:468 stop:1304 length:837 start_codon:yes stop_codon:yes gene_type:complete